MRAIESKSNPLVKELCALARDSREIKVRRRTLIEGPHLTAAYLHSGGIPDLLVVSSSGTTSPEIVGLMEKWPDVEIVRLSDGLFREISGVATPVGILAVIPVPPTPSGQVEGDCVMLDAVQDAGNVGTILRTAAAAGIREAVLGQGCASAWSPKVLRAAQGAHFGLRIREMADIKCVMAAYSGASVATVARNGTSVFDLNLSGITAWIFGNEGSGVNHELVARATMHATIPIAVGIESLNVAAAAAVCIFEQVRQRRLAVEG